MEHSNRGEMGVVTGYTLHTGCLVQWVFLNICHLGPGELSTAKWFFTTEWNMMGYVEEL